MVRFGAELTLNLVPEWQEHYVNYDKLKLLGASDAPSDASDASCTEQRQSEVLDTLVRECERVCAFFAEQLRGCERAWASLEREALELLAPELAPLPELRASLCAAAGSPPHLGAPLLPVAPPAARRAVSLGARRHTGPRFYDLAERALGLGSRRASEQSDEEAGGAEADVAKRRFYALYTRLHDLRNFRELNLRGFKKCIKKVEKNSALRIRAAFADRIAVLELVTSGRADELLHAVAVAYARLFCAGDAREAVERLRDGLHELLTFRRETVWQNAAARTAAGAAGARQLQPAGRSGFYACRPRGVLVALGLLGALLAAPAARAPDESAAAARCLALLACLVALWASESIPLFATSMAVAPLVVALRVLPGRTPQQAAAEVVQAMPSPTIALVVFGFSLASALSKFRLDKMFASELLARAGTRPEAFLLATMLVSASISALVSNVASPVLAASVVLPALRPLPPRSRFRRTVLLAIAVSCNVGGMLTPIASPQNVAALHALATVGDARGVSFVMWLLCALPVAACLLLLAYIGLLLTSPVEIVAVPAVPRTREAWTRSHSYVLGVGALAVALMSSAHALEPIVGDVGVSAAIPLLLLYAPGVLSSEDFNGLPWHIVALVAGGLALGHAVRESNLLQAVSAEVSAAVGARGDGALLVVFVPLIAVVTSLISHTVGALILLPIVASAACAGAGADVGGDVGACDIARRRALVLSSAFMCSASMALPVSSFPNVASLSVADPATGEAYLRAHHLLPVGTLMTAAAVVVVVVIAFPWIVALGALMP
ncbi:hypothetical protein KFE25_006659 [Diacronema lutheri]|uniref:SPX domain-containing protein n=1 Tax=Diacronema lutheri TaxID=2081491 RepID=A0A8J5XSD1_DIALT|nr:hypothetical protein KFE25_006659 [Diacronema lutheri]